jgi:predicted dehydrogenase
MTLRILQLGGGNRGCMWARVAARSAAGRIAAGSAAGRIAAIVDPSPAARDRFGAENPEVPWFADLDAALAAGPYDAALLVTPPDGHLEQCRRLFAAGLPILAEKPLADTLESSIAIVDLADAAGLPLTVGLNFRYLPCSRTMRDWLTGERLGRVGFGQFSYLRNRDGKRPGLNRYPLTMEHPMMLEQTIHHLDLIRFCHGREVEQIACRTWNPPWSMYAHDANVHCLLRMQDGIEVNYFGTWAGGWNNLDFEWRIDCADGVFVQRALFGDCAYACTADSALTPIPIAEEEPFLDDTAHLLDAFVAAVKDGTPPPCDGRDHLRSLGLCFAGLESAQTGRAVTMADFYRRTGMSRVL